MVNSETLAKFGAILNAGISGNQLVKLTLGMYQGNDKELKNLYVKPVLIKRVKMLSFNYRYKTRDIFKNFSIAEGLNLIQNLLSNDFRMATLFLVDKEVTVEQHKKNGMILREKLLHVKLDPNLNHNKEKQRVIKAEENKYLHALGITDFEGKVYKNAQSKYKQINQYIEILSSLIKELPDSTIKTVVDMGSGKGYLTFALYDYICNILKNKKVVVTGVEFRPDLVDLCNQIADKSNFDHLSFVEGTIENYKVEEINLLIALHACDTATDDAIYKGIKAGAELIVVAPCCHKQIRREIEKNKVHNDVSFLTKYGIFLERQAEMVTDGMRAMILEYFGYKTKVFEFISDAHTPKNVLVVGVKRKQKSGFISQRSDEQKEILQKLKDTKAYFGIGYHHLEKLFEL